MAKRYFPRGPLQREAMTDRLLGAAEAIAERREAGKSIERQDRAAHAVICGISAYAYTVGGEPSPGDPIRKAKDGDIHNLSFSLAQGAALIVRRGTEQCMTTTYRVGPAGQLELAPSGERDRDGALIPRACRAKAGANGYCERCATNESLTHERDARRKIIETTVRHAPRLYGDPRARRRARQDPRLGARSLTEGSV